MKNSAKHCIVVLFLIFIITGCSVNPPQNKTNLCALFRENQDWYTAAHETYQKWRLPIAVQMAMMFQESSFVADARPPFDPKRAIQSSALGYAQAKDETWADYVAWTHRESADRENFADAVDFMGWYCHLSHQKLQIPKSDANQLYLAYHEGHGGFQRQTYLKKPWLIRTAQKVAWRAIHYQQQLNQCEHEFKGNNWFF